MVIATWILAISTGALAVPVVVSLVRYLRRTYVKRRAAISVKDTSAAMLVSVIIAVGLSYVLFGSNK